MYARFSEVYDRLMGDVNYEAWADYMLRLLQRENIVPKTACDAGCGTGGLTFALKKRGISVTGVDISEEMLMVAAEKARRFGVKTPFVRQDMASLVLHKPVDAVFSAIDGVNYLLTEERLQGFFDAAYHGLCPKGGLVFDISTREKLKNMDGKLFFEEHEDLSYFWQNAYDSASDLLTMELTFFQRRKDGFYERFVERQRQRAHTYKELERLLKKSGFSAVFGFGDQTEALPKSEEIRIFVLAIKEDTKAVGTP